MPYYGLINKDNEIIKMIQSDCPDQAEHIFKDGMSEDILNNYSIKLLKVTICNSDEIKKEKQKFKK